MTFSLAPFISWSAFHRGYNIGVRLIEDFLARSNIGRCQDFRETADVIAKVSGKVSELSERDRGRLPKDRGERTRMSRWEGRNIQIGDTKAFWKKGRVEEQE